ncbi:PmeII family type II restriction endonuclease [Parvibaculum sp.]|uniref:PmeII family type II restriction endonuclease n=1 Tax=Parvibaculum sp. TaxID=2024848 RepID=UPI003BAC36BB
MASGHPKLPKKTPATILSKRAIFSALKDIDDDNAARNRVLAMEEEFRKRIDGHLTALPTANAEFRKFNTSPFVLMFYSRQQNYARVKQIEKDIVPAKVFSSMETSAGRMVETVVLPIYGWQVVPSSMHSIESVLDGRKTVSDGTFMAATLKSGPRCLNDEMSKDIGKDVVANVHAWAKSHGSSKVDFTYGVLYGTKKQSNKKDWHVLRNIEESLDTSAKIISPCDGQWSLSYQESKLDVTATVRVGIEWWDYLGGENTWIELCAALIRVCISPTGDTLQTANYVISDLKDILDLSSIPKSFNVALLQKSQLEWLLFLARHFCDELAP